MSHDIEKNKIFLGFYYVEAEYADFLRDECYGDRHVPLTRAEHYRHDKFFIGALLDVYEQKYFAPVSSKVYRPSDAAFYIYDRHGKVTAAIKTNFMFPVIDGVCERLDFKELKPEGYKDLVIQQYIFCNRHRSEIVKLAQDIYDIRKSGETLTPDGIYINNFLKLEQRAEEFRKNKMEGDQYMITVQHIAENLGISVEQVLESNKLFEAQKNLHQAIERPDVQTKKQADTQKPKTQTEIFVTLTQNKKRRDSGFSSK